ncbi:hypothetical protein KEM52_002353 [Ascosphaera acerosa]|nr:hypothetical protein KEM52_002353 [Ascosphaera acerosa]
MTSPRSVPRASGAGDHPQNRAAWLTTEDGEFIVGDAPYPRPEAHEVVVRNRAVAINNFEWQLQSDPGDKRIIPEYPFIIGADCAGEVAEVGPGVARFKPGDRVIGMANWLYTKKSRDAAFQLYCVVHEAVMAPIGPEIPFVEGTTLPLAVSAASLALYPPDRLGLAPPSPRGQSRRGQKMLVWGASSTTGIVAVQLALASGAAVVAVASPANHAFVMALGATAVFAYDDPRNLEKIILVLKQMPGEFVGAYDTIGSRATIKSCAGVVLSLGAGKVVTNSPFVGDQAPLGVKTVSVDDTPLIAENKFVTDMIWEKFVPVGLETKAIKDFPQPIVIGKGLEFIGKGVDRLRQGVSAGKVVVEL